MKKPARKALWLVALPLSAGMILYLAWPSRAENGPTSLPASSSTVSAQEHRIDLSATQIKSVQVETVSVHDFIQKQEALGNVALNDDQTVQIFPPYAGKITEIYSDLGHDVAKGAPLYAIDSPDLQQAESTLIAAAGVLELTQQALERARALYAAQGIAQKDLQQAISDSQTATGNYSSAYDALRIFGKTPRQIEDLLRQKKVDARLVVFCPLAGRVVARNAAIGTLTQPGNAPAPLVVADISTLWMIANVTETDVTGIGLGQSVEVALTAFPGRTFQGHVTYIGTALDPNTHRLPVRTEIKDPTHELHPGMLASFVIQTSRVIHAPGLPQDAVVREGDGTLSIWITTDRHRFFKRSIRIGLQQDGLYQVVSGVQPGELVATEGAIFLSHAFETETR